MDKLGIVLYENGYEIEPVFEDDGQIEPVKFWFKKEIQVFGFNIKIEISK